MTPPTASNPPPEPPRANIDQSVEHVSGGTVNMIGVQQNVQTQTINNYYPPNWDELAAHSGGDSSIVIKTSDDTPERPRKLIGRDDLLTRADGLLDSGEPLLLCGFGGMGKTALAAEIIARRVERGETPALWLHAGSADADALFEALARGFGVEQVRAVASQSGDAKLAVMRELLTQAGIKLVALDDVWNGEALHQAVKALPRRVKLLVTARQRYPLDGESIDVAELAPDDALALLKFHAKTYADDPQADNLCELLGYHAFALELAGKTMKARQWSPERLMQAMGDAPHALEAPANYGDPHRRSVEMLIDASLNALDEDARQVFLAFGALFAPTVTAELVALYQYGKKPGLFGRLLGRKMSVSDSQLRQINQMLEMLYDNGLAERFDLPASVEAYRVHDLAYSYARARADEVALVKGLSGCLAYVERYAEPNLPNFAALRPLLANWLNAAKWALAAGRYDETQRLTLLYQGPQTQGGFLALQGYAVQAANLLAVSMLAAERQGNKQAQGTHLNNLGIAYADLGQYEQAIDYYERALTINREIGDKCGESDTLNNLGNAYNNIKKIERAIDYHEQALAISKDYSDKRRERVALGNLGNDYFSLGQYEQAIGYYKRAQAIDQEIGDKSGIGNTVDNLGSVYAILGQYEQAIDYLHQALAISRELGDRQREANNLNNIGVLHAKQGAYTLALDYFHQARVIFTIIDAQHRVVHVDRGINIARAKLSGAGGTETPE